MRLFLFYCTNKFVPTIHYLRFLTPPLPDSSVRSELWLRTWFGMTVSVRLLRHLPPPMTIRCGTGMSRLSLLRVISDEQDSPRFNRGLPGDVDALKSERGMWMSKKIDNKYN